MRFLNLRKSLIEIIALAYIAYFVVHSVRFFMSNGLCSGWGTGIIHGNESAGAGALPPVLEFSHFLPVDFLRPFTTRDNMLTLLSLVIVSSILLFHLIRICLRKQIYSMRTTLLLLAFVAPVITSDFERYTDCSLNHTHLNIQRTFALLHSAATDEATLRDKRLLKTYDVHSVRLSDNNRQEILELFGHYGEPTCGAYIVALAHADEIAPRERFPNWITFNHNAYDDSEFAAVLEKITSSFNTRSRLYFSFKQFSPYEKTSDGFAAKDHFSAIACTAWPYGWVDELALAGDKLDRGEARLLQRHPKRMSNHG